MWQGWQSVLSGGTEVKMKQGGKYLMHAHLAEYDNNVKNPKMISHHKHSSIQ